MHHRVCLYRHFLLVVLWEEFSGSRLFTQVVNRRKEKCKLMVKIFQYITGDEPAVWFIYIYIYKCIAHFEQVLQNLPERKTKKVANMSKSGQSCASWMQNI